MNEMDRNLSKYLKFVKQGERLVSGDSKYGWTIQPKLLSVRDKEYYQLCISLNGFEVEGLCEVLLHSTEEIFTERNLMNISGYGEITIGEKKYRVYGLMKDVLILIHEGKWKKDDILHDVCHLLGMLGKKELFRKCYDYLIEIGYIRPIDKLCVKCGKIIKEGDPYVMTVVTEEIFCPDCDKPLVREGDIIID